MGQRKVKNGEKSPWAQCLTRPVPNGRRRSDFWLVPENFCVFLPNQNAEWRRPFGTGLVRHYHQGLFTPFFTFLRAIFFLRLDFPSPPLSAPRSLRMPCSPLYNKRGHSRLCTPLTMHLQDELSNENIMCKGIFQFKSQCSLMFLVFITLSPCVNLWCFLYGIFGRTMPLL